jgi:hypothetical protein
MAHVTSADGTSIAHQRCGSGPAVILIGGAYAVQREIEDIAALLAQAGGSACLFGASSGMFALEAAAAGLAVERVAVYEVPYDTADGALQRARDYQEQLGVALAAGRRSDALSLFMRLAGSSETDIAEAKNSPYWPDLEDLADTLAYDGALYGPPPTNRLATPKRLTMRTSRAASCCCSTSTRTSSAATRGTGSFRERRPRALAPSGQAGNHPVLLVDGLVAGVWHQSHSGRQIEITVEPLIRLTAGQRRALQAQVDRIGQVLEGNARFTTGTVSVGGHA